MRGDAPTNLFEGVGIRRLGFRIKNGVVITIVSRVSHVRRIILDGQSNELGRRVPVVADVLVGEVAPR